jgi:methylenetetrahydrofolate reductase (NADPH)
VQRFNDGFFADGTPIKNPGRPFDFGVACYPEKHEEAPNLERDMQYLKEKQDLGAQYAVTQLFFDNKKYFQFVEKAREMGITDLLLLRGDKAKDDSVFKPTPGGHAHTTDLIRQVQQFNNGFFADGSPIKNPGARFDIGVACYPEKHEEAPNLEMDMQYLKEKQDLGAQYAVTQLFFDNQKYFDFVDRARKMGITIPIIPGIKPLAKLSQLTVVPRTFHCDIPEPLAREIVKCKTDEDARMLGIEWTTQQCRELYEHGIHNIHFYTVSAVDSVVEITKQLL